MVECYEITTESANKVIDIFSDAYHSVIKIADMVDSIYSEYMCENAKYWVGYNPYPYSNMSKMEYRHIDSDDQISIDDKGQICLKIPVVQNAYMAIGDEIILNPMAQYHKIETINMGFAVAYFDPNEPPEKLKLILQVRLLGDMEVVLREMGTTNQIIKNAIQAVSEYGDTIYNYLEEKYPPEDSVVQPNYLS